MKTKRNNIRAIWRLRRIKAEVPGIFDGAVHNCAKVSALNHSLAFVIQKVGVFGGPKVEQIKRPVAVSLSETDACVIVKDGCAYELSKRRP